MSEKNENKNVCSKKKKRNNFYLKIMSKKNYNINLQDSSYYISLNIIKKKQFDNLILKPPKPLIQQQQRTHFTSYKQKQKSPYDELLIKNNNTIEKLRQRLKLVNDISNLNNKLPNKIDTNTKKYNFATNNFKQSSKFNTELFKSNFEQPTTNYTSNFIIKAPFIKRSISSTGDYESNFNLKKKPLNNYFQHAQLGSSFSLEKPSYNTEMKDSSTTNTVSTISLSSTNKTLKSTSSLDLDKLSLNKFVMLDRRKNSKKSGDCVVHQPLRKEFKPLVLNTTESSQMSSIRSMGSNELDLYIDSLIRQFRLKSKISTNNSTNISNAATVTSSAEAGSAGTATGSSNSNDNTTEIVSETKINNISNEKCLSNDEEEDSEDDDDEDGSTFINYTHSYEIDDLDQLSLMDQEDDLNFTNTNDKTNSKK